MDENRAIRRERQALLRLAAVLVVLSGLAERVAALPRPLRAMLLWLFRSGEAATRRLACDVAQDWGCRLDMPPLVLSRGGDGPADAVALAEAFDLLARALDDLAAYMCGWLTDPRPRDAMDPAQGGEDDRPSGQTAILLSGAGHAAGLRPRAPDTS